MALAPSMLLLSLLQFIILPLCILSQQITSPIKLRSTLSTNNSTWNSPSGDFALGFHKINDASYLLSIWYAKMPDTIVWYAGADGILASKGSVLKCTADQGLVLNDPQGHSLWQANISSTASSCVLNDTGNLMIKGSKGDTLWQSFDDPRDTLLPSQKIRNLGSGPPKVYSRRSKSNFSRGKFQLRLQDDGNLVLNRRSLVTDNSYYVPYYKSDTSDSSNPGYLVNYDVSGHMYVLQKNGSEVDLLQGKNVPSPSKNYYFRATLNYDGVFVWYYLEKNIISGSTSSWTVISWEPENICLSERASMDSGVCGYNSICNINNTGEYQYPTCECPPKYSLVDPNDAFGNCKPDFRLPAHDEEIGYRLEELAMIDFPLRDYDMLNPISEDECKSSCLNDSFCVAIVLNGQTCWKKSFPLGNGRTDPTRTAFIKVSDVNNDGTNSSVNVPNLTRSCKVMNPTTSALMGTSVFVSLLLVGALVGFWLFCHRDHRAHPHKASGPLVMNWSNMSCFTYKALEEATNGFQEEIGRGACAIVYKGVIDDSETLIAVKKIDRALLREADKEFKTEVSVIGKTHHKNLVRLIGFCHEEEHRVLVYEYMRNGSLAHFLFGQTRPSWSVRAQIAQGIARGLLYLHEECGNQIIHCDIKPQNILLDDYFEARISDFGLSKLLMLNQFQTHTAIRGTKGYVAPEWFGNKPVTVKVDVYSFGVVLLELISCRRCINMETDEEERTILIDWALDCYQLGDVSSFVDNDVEALHDKERLDRFLKVGIWCVQVDPNARPTMRQVSLSLEGVIEVSAPPNLDENSQSVSIVSDY